MAVIEWKQIKPDFSSSNNSMQNAMSGLSNAGTVFDKLRQSILDEEQRALENAYRQQTFDENVRQFELQQALNREKFNEDVRQFEADLQWQKENAIAGREFQAEQAEKADQRATARLRLSHQLDEQTKGKTAANYNALNTYFLTDYKKHGDLRKADENTRAFANANFPNLPYDTGKIYGDYADAVTASYSPDTRAVQLWDVLTQAGTAGGERVGSEQQLRNDYSHMMSANGKVFQEVNGTMYTVPDSEAQTYLQLQNDKKRFAELEQKGLDILKGLGMDESQSRRFLNNVMSKAVIDKETALLELTSKLGVADPSKIPVFNAIIEGASNARAATALKAKTEEERKQTFTEAAYSKTFNNVFTETQKNSNDIFNVEKNPELMASIKVVADAMREREVPSAVYETFLRQLVDVNRKDGLWKNNDIRSEELDNPVLIAARNEYLPELVKPETEEKPKAPATSGSTKSSPNSTKPPLTEKLESIDTKSAPVVIKALEGYRQQLQNVSDSSVVDPKALQDRMAKLDAAIKNLRDGTPIVVSDREFYTFLRKAINNIAYHNVTADEQGKAVFTQVEDLADRFLRLSEEAAKTGK